MTGGRTGRLLPASAHPGNVALAATLLAGVVFGLALAAPPGPLNAVIAEESALRGWAAGVRAGVGAMSADLVFLALAWVGLVAVVDRHPTVRGVVAGAGGLLMLYFAAVAARGALDERAAFDSAGPPGDPHDPAAPADAADPDGSPAPADGVGHADPATLADTTDTTDTTDVTDTTDSANAADARGFAKAFALALTNPYQALFWLTVGTGLLRPGRVDVLSHAPYLGEHLAGALVVTTGSPTLVVALFGGILLWVVGFPATLVSLGRRVDGLAPVVAAASAAVLAGFGVFFLAEAAGVLLGPG